MMEHVEDWEMKSRMRSVRNVLKYGCVLAGVFLVCGCGNKDVEKSEEVSSQKNVSELLETEQVSEIVDTTEKNDFSYNGLIFRTDYTIEDYCQGCFIVSKNDGLLYGLLDKDGNEILPVKYDDIDFMNAEEVKEGKNQKLYIKVRYENSYMIMNSSGEQISDRNLEYIDYYLFEDKENYAFFWEKDELEKNCRLYNERGDVLAEYSWKDYDFIECRGITPDRYMIKGEKMVSFVKSEYHTKLVDSSLQTLYEWDFCLGQIHNVGESHVYFCMVESYDNYHQYEISMSGEVEKVGVVNQKEAEKEYMEWYTSSRNNPLKEQYYLGENQDIILYKSNNTWKLVDANGVPLYDERYYNCIYKMGCYFLLNEDNQMCLIDRNGRKLVDYEYLTGDNERIYFMGTMLTGNNYFIGDDGVCFVMSDGVYFFEGEK